MTAWQDTTICGSFAILKSDIPKLFPASMKVDWSASQKHLENSNYDASWFKPDSVKVFKSAEVMHPTKNCSLRMLYDDSTDSNTLTTMYLTWGDM